MSVDKKPIRKGDIAIRDVLPEIDGGEYPVKRVQGDILKLSANVFTTGVAKLYAFALYKTPNDSDWRTTPMKPAGDNSWQGEIQLNEIGEYQYSVEAGRDHYSSWVESLRRWAEAGEDLSSEVQDGVRMLERAAKDASGEDLLLLKQTLDSAARAKGEKLLQLLSRQELREAVIRSTKGRECERYKTLSLVVERRKAIFATWYEMFPRSQGTAPGKYGTFRDCVRRIPDIASMGFDVIYLPPIHPRGRTNRRGRDNSPNAKETDPGSPWAIGSKDGGHTAIDPELGTFDDFEKFLSETKSAGIELALDLAFQCSPDHPWVKEHPEWFYHRADGSIRYAENPPKRYPDVYPLDFDCTNWWELWQALYEIVDFWVKKGIKIFRVDNPHTKPFSFWKWLIAKVRANFPEVVFLAEAFTTPAVMYQLAKLGFSQSYTYFTWRNYKTEIESYFQELNEGSLLEFFRPMLFPSTPDILPYVLQNGGRPAFAMRAILAATLSSLYGIYNGYELCENRGIPGKEEYAQSEKYEVRIRDWNAPGNIKPIIAKLNELRRAYPALQRLGNTLFCTVDNPNLVAYLRLGRRNEKTLLIVVNVNPFEEHAGLVDLPLTGLEFDVTGSYPVRDLLTGTTYAWHGTRNYVKLNPYIQPAHVFEFAVGDK